jgi:hypothetical protein
MYIIDDTFFQYPNREIPNLNEADSNAFSELERLIDSECRLFMRNFLTDAEVVDFDRCLVGGLFPTVTTGIPQKWIDLVNGKGDWKGLVYTLGTSKNSLLADYVYYHYLVNEASYMTGVGEVRANAKGSMNVNPTQRIVRVWNEFVLQYQQGMPNSYYTNRVVPSGCYYSLLQFLVDNSNVYEANYATMTEFKFKNQLGL